MALKGQQINISIRKRTPTGAITTIAKSTGCKISCSLATEDATTFDEYLNEDGTVQTGVLWESPDLGSKSWQVTVDKLYASNGTPFTGVLTPGDIYELSFTIGNTAFVGPAIYNQADVDAQNKQNTSGSDTFTGIGKLEYGSDVTQLLIGFNSKGFRIADASSTTLVTGAHVYLYYRLTGEIVTYGYIDQKNIGDISGTGTISVAGAFSVTGLNTASTKPAKNTQYSLKLASKTFSGNVELLGIAVTSKAYASWSEIPPRFKQSFEESPIDMTTFTS